MTINVDLMKTGVELMNPGVEPMMNPGVELTMNTGGKPTMNPGGKLMMNRGVEPMKNGGGKLMMNRGGKPMRNGGGTTPRSASSLGATIGRFNRSGLQSQSTVMLIGKKRAASLSYCNSR